MENLSRRRFLQGTAAVAFAGLCTWPVTAQSVAAAPGPFELAGELKALALSSGRPVLDAGTGNPNFLHLGARRAHGQLTQVALDLTGASGLRPSRSNLGSRFFRLLDSLPKETGLAKAVWHKAHEVSGLSFDEVADQLLQMLLGTTYAGFQPLARAAALSYQRQELRLSPDDSWHFFPTSGASEALKLIFERFTSSGILSPSRGLAEVVPTFSPFSVWPELKGDFSIQSVALEPEQWTLPEESLRKLADPKVRVLYLVDPGNPVPTALDDGSVNRLVRLVREERQDLIILADSVYGSFVDQYNPIISALPKNTIGIGSWSKHFGATGWRLGCLLVHSESVLGPLLDVPLEEFVNPGPVILPQQGMLTVFSLTQLTEWGQKYDAHLNGLLSKRWKALYDGLGTTAPSSPRYSHFFAAVSLEQVAKSNGLKPWPKERELDFLRRLAANHGAVCLACSGFSGPPGLLRISLASLSEEQSKSLGLSILDVLRRGPLP